MKWLLKKYMVEQHIESLSSLSKLTGIAKRTLYDRIAQPTTLKVFEIKALDDVLHFSDEDMVKLARGLV